MKLPIVALHLASVLALAAAAGCSKNEPPPGARESPAIAEPAVPPARTLSIPGQDGSRATPDPETASAGMVWLPPEGWIEEPASGMRRAQYRVEGPGGPGECLVFYFGPGMGGEPMANAVRWAQQFEQPDGSSSIEAMKVSQLEGTGVPVVLVEVSGTYDGGMTSTDAPAQHKPDYTLLGAIVEGREAPWFFKFTGPKETVRAQRADFIKMMESLRQAG